MGNCCPSKSIRVLDHPHKLHLQSSPGTYCCDGCKELGYGKRYRCLQCPSYQRHKECCDSEKSHRTHSSFFEGIEFTFHIQSPKHVKSCVACGENVRGFRYQSPRKKGFLNRFFPSKTIVLHPCCFKLPINRDNQGLDATGGRVNLELNEEAPSDCLLCPRRKISQKIKGWAYVSTGGNYCYHVACVKKLIGNQEQASDGNVSLKVSRSALRAGGEMMVMILQLIISAIVGDLISLILIPVQ